MRVFIVFSAILVLAVCQHDHHKNLNAEAEHLFTLMDSDRNGDLTLTEVHEVFDNYDGNDDHRVTEYEFYHRLCSSSPEICPETIGLFQELDTLNENVLWADNLHNIYSLFDSNSNGMVTRSEFVTWLTNKLTELSKTVKGR